MTVGRFSMVAVVGLTGALAVGSGCNIYTDGYYCDNRGCYTCDGYGCADVPPPSKSTCRGNVSCGPDGVCTELGCAQRCSSDSGCPRGEVCRGSLCVAPTTSEPPKTKECTEKADCGQGKACVAGVCSVCGGTSGPCPCAGPSECASNEACVANACIPKTATCTFSSECGPGLICAEGQCLSGCDAQKPCSSGFTCDRGVCRPEPTGRDCSNGAPCPTDAPLCVAGRCTAACTSDAQCGQGKYCNQGACVVDTRPKPNCTDDTQCAGSPNPRTCIGGFCKYRCTSDQICRTIDTRIGYCAKDGVCRSAQEANPECINSTQCAQGKLCIDNQCR